MSEQLAIKLSTRMNAIDLSQVNFGTDAQPDNKNLTVYYDNDSRPTPKDTNLPHVVFTVLDGQTQQRSLGCPSATRIRTPGVGVASIFVPVGIGDAGARRVADLILPQFRLVTADGVSYKVPYFTPVGRTGAWWQGNVNLPFTYDELISPLAS